MRTIEQRRKHKLASFSSGQEAANRMPQNLPATLFKRSLRDWQAAYKAQHQAADGSRGTSQSA